MRLYSGEKEIINWQKTTISEFAKLIGQNNQDKPLVIAVDGRSAGGKTTLAKNLAIELNAALLSTDDFAWWHSYFDWPEILIPNGINPLVAGNGIDYTPDAWTAKSREGSIKAEPKDFIIVEGVGAAQKTMRAAVDVIIWVQSDEGLARERGINRDLAERPDVDEAIRFWNEWQSNEDPFQAEQKTWEVANFIVLGTPDYSKLESDELYLAP